MAKRMNSEEQMHWERHTPDTALFPFDRDKSKNTIESAKKVENAKDMCHFAELFPEEAATLAWVYEPNAINYYFPLLVNLSEEDKTLVRNVIKTQIYSKLLKRCRDSSLLDRLEFSISPTIEITFNVLPKIGKDEPAA
jgi:hypothetical protein